MTPTDEANRRALITGMSDTDHFALATEEFLSSPDGRALCNAETLGMPANERLLRDRILDAFTAGWEQCTGAIEGGYRPDPEKPDQEHPAEPEPKPEPLTWYEARAKAVCDALDISFNDLVSGKRLPELVRGRKIVAVVLYGYKGPGCEQMSLADIGAKLYGVKHSTVVHQHREAVKNADVMNEAEQLAARFGWRRHRRT